MKKNRKIIIIVSVVVVVALLVLTTILCIVNNKSKQGSTQGETTYSANVSKKGYDTKEAEKNIQCIGDVDKSGNFIVIAKNNNNYQVNGVTITVSFYDEENNIIGTDESTFEMIGSNREVAFGVLDTPKNFAKHEFSINVSKQDYNLISYVNDLEINSNDTGDKVIVQIKNNSNEDIDYLHIGVVFYNEDKIVGYGTDVEYDVGTSKTANFSIRYPYDSGFDSIEFDRYSVYINSAFSY